MGHTTVLYIGIARTGSDAARAVYNLCQADEIEIVDSGPKVLAEAFKRGLSVGETKPLHI